MPENIIRQSSSFRDKSGFIFKKDGELFRQVSNDYKEEFDLFISSGLYEDLVEDEMLISHQEMDVSDFDIPNTYKILRPTKVPFISYPYEWCFSQLKDAAKLTLELQLVAMKKGLVLKDASAYNVQFMNGKPVFIDTLSFEKYNPSEPWIAYKQFCQHFLGPLALMAKSHISLGRISQLFIDGIPLDIVSKLLPWRTKLSLTLGIHIHLHSKSQNKHSRNTNISKVKCSFNENKMQVLIKGLLIAVEKLSWQGGNTEWADYYEITNNYGVDGIEEKAILVKQFIKAANPSSVWDLGANVGKFSKLATDYGANTVSLDIDPSCVEWNYRNNKANDGNPPLALFHDLVNPSPNIGWANNERDSLSERGPVDAILALGLIHHIVISNNVPMEMVAHYFSKLTKFLIIEFVPKEDSQVELLLQTRKDVFPDYNIETFEKVIQQYFTLIKRENIPKTRRTLFLCGRLEK